VHECKHKVLTSLHRQRISQNSHLAKISQNSHFHVEQCSTLNWHQLHIRNRGCGSWKRLNFCGSGSTLKKEAGNGSNLGSVRLFEQPEAEAFFIKHGAGMWKLEAVKFLWKWKHFEEAGSGSNLGSVLTFSGAGSGSIFRKT